MHATALSGAVAEFAATHHGVFTKSLAADCGMTAKQLAALGRRGVIERVANGLWLVAGTPRTWHQRAAAASLVGQSVVVGESAAVLHQLDGARAGDITVALGHGTRNALADRSVQSLHSYSVDDVVVIDGIRCSGVARTVCDSAWLAPQILSRMLDDFQRRGYSIHWLEQTMKRVAGIHLHGTRRLADELDARRAGGAVSESWFERLVERLVTRANIGPVIRQYQVFDDEGSFVARVDLAAPHLRLAIEAHSRRFHTGPRREAFDQRRDNRLAAAGWEVVYVGWADSSAEATAQHIRAIAQRRARDLGVRLAG